MNIHEVLLSSTTIENKLFDPIYVYKVSMVSCCAAGLFSSIMRDLANIPTDSPKWIVLDGDIDPMWIESLNTVMDDNKAR